MTDFDKNTITVGSASDYPDAGEAIGVDILI